MERLTSYAQISDSVIGDEVHYLVELSTLAWVLGAEFPQAVEPCELEELLRKEKAGNEEGL